MCFCKSSATRNRGCNHVCACPTFGLRPDATLATSRSGRKLKFLGSFHSTPANHSSSAANLYFHCLQQPTSLDSTLSNPTSLSTVLIVKHYILIVNATPCTLQATVECWSSPTCSVDSDQDFSLTKYAAWRSKKDHKHSSLRL
jgi:hypothetical protein